LSVAGNYIDIFKVAIGTARLFPKELLVEKLPLLRGHQVRPFLSGQMQEYMLHTRCIAALPAHFEEARAVGFDMIEISDNIVELGDGVRDRMIRMAQDAGLAPVG
jgi:phosphosulfolactate synthase (CoM biosynthesis protein A)